VAYTGALVVLSRPTATNRPEESTVTDSILASGVDPFISAGVVHVDPLDDVAYILIPTATNRPEELTATEFIVAGAVDPFINAGVVHVDPLDDVAYKGALVLSDPTATNFPEELTVTDTIWA